MSAPEVVATDSADRRASSGTDGARSLAALDEATGVDVPEQDYCEAEHGRHDREPPRDPTGLGRGDRLRQTMRRGILGLALLGVFAPAAHAAHWGAPFTVTGDPRVATLSAGADARGAMVVVWQHNTGRTQAPQDGGYGGVESSIRARAIGADGRLRTIQRLSITGELTTGPQVAVNRQGAALAVWTQAYDGHRFTIVAMPSPPGRRFGSRQALGRTNRFRGGSPRVAINARGDAVVMWARSDSVVLATRPAGRRFAAPQAIAAARPVPGGVVVDSDGDALAAWTAHGRVFVAERSAGHPFGRARLLNPRGPRASDASAAVGRDGTVVVAWNAGNATTAVVRGPGGRFAAPQTLASYSPFLNAAAPAVAVTPSGEAVVAWGQGVQDPAGDRTQVAVASRLPSGSFGAPRVLSAPGVSASQPSLAVEGTGELVAAWSEAGPIGPNARWWVSTAERPAGVALFTAAQRMSGTGNTFRPTALLGADAAAVLVWHPDDAPVLAARRGG